MIQSLYELGFQLFWFDFRVEILHNNVWMWPALFVNAHQHDMSSALQKLRIIAIPLTRPNVSLTLPHRKSKSSRLVYYQFQIKVPVLKPPPRLASGDQEGETNAKKKGWFPEEGIAKWTINKAADIWAGFGKQKSGWKVCSLFIVDEFSCDLSLAESISGRRADNGPYRIWRASSEEYRLVHGSIPCTIRVRKQKSPIDGTAICNYFVSIMYVLTQKDKVSLVYPPSFFSSSEVLSELYGYAERRIPKHRKGFYLWMLMAPMTAPFILIRASTFHLYPSII